MPNTVPVRVRDCPDGTHPEGDSVFIAEKLSLAGGIEARLRQNEINKTLTGTDDRARIAGELTTAWMDTFVRHGAVAWNLHDADDPEPWPFDVKVLTDDFGLGWPVAEAANDLYAEGLLGTAVPLAQKRPTRSPRGRTAASTSKKPPTTSPLRSSASPTAGTLSAMSR